MYKEGLFSFVCRIVLIIIIFNHTAMNADKKFWADPNSYLQPPAPYYPYAAHFILYNFKFTQPFSTEDLSEVKLAGMLHYKVCGVHLAYWLRRSDMARLSWFDRKHM